MYSIMLPILSLIRHIALFAKGKHWENYAAPIAKKHSEDTVACASHYKAFQHATTAINLLSVKYQKIILALCARKTKKI